MTIALEPGCTITGVDISEGLFAEADLAGARFTDCTLRDVQLSGTCLQDARFINCRLIRCRFANADLRDALFEGCNFGDEAGHEGVQFAFSQLDQARFLRSDLSFARFDHSSLFGVEADACNLRGAIFHKADFSRAFGRKLVKTAATIRGCNLEIADLTDARLAGADLAGSNFREALLLDADLEGADLRGCDFVQALTHGAKFARADVRDADLAGLCLRELASMDGMIISADQQFPLLAAMGLEIYAD